MTMTRSHRADPRRTAAPGRLPPPPFFSSPAATIRPAAIRRACVRRHTCRVTSRPSARASTGWPIAAGTTDPDGDAAVAAGMTIGMTTGAEVPAR